MSYAQLLQTKEWKDKANQIRERDKHTCQRCGLNSSLRFHTYTAEISNSGKAEWLYFEKSNLNRLNVVSFEIAGRVYVCRTHLSKEILDSENEQLCMVIHLRAKSSKGEKLNGSVKSIKPKISFGHINALNAEHFKMQKNEIDWSVLDIDVESFWLKQKEEKSYTKNDRLHVHHLCYREGVEVWNYPDSDYLTLCNICHSIMHEDFSIPIIKKDGSVTYIVEPCNRCGGTGYLPEYSHVSGGICFRCGGIGGKVDTDNSQFGSFI